MTAFGGVRLESSFKDKSVFMFDGPGRPPSASHLWPGSLLLLNEHRVSKHFIRRDAASAARFFQMIHA